MDMHNLANPLSSDSVVYGMPGIVCIIDEAGGTRGTIIADQSFSLAQFSFTEQVTYDYVDLCYACWLPKIGAIRSYGS